MHLGELELGLRADTLGEGRVADHIAECLSVYPTMSIISFELLFWFKHIETRVEV